jgi:single-strand DNA-binding protein
LVTGSRTWTDTAAITAALDKLHAVHGTDLVLVHGACPRGADAIADRWAYRHAVTTDTYPADWGLLGRRAGMARNTTMVTTGPALCLAFIRDQSPGATGCAALAAQAGIPTIRTRPSSPVHCPEGTPAMAGDTTITVIGNLTDDPELRFTPSGVALAKFRIASTPRFYDQAAGDWKNGDPLFLTGTVWRQPAENVAESLSRGARVIVTGRLRQHSYETKAGEKRTVIEMEVDEIGPSLRYATTTVKKLDRSNGHTTAGPVEDAWSIASPAPSGTDDEPPF